MSSKGRGCDEGDDPMELEERSIKSLVGKKYTLENGRKLRYGGRINSKGIITRAYTKRDMNERISTCKKLKESFNNSEE
jgi:hypothetical protein